MAITFLSARWSNLALVTYAFDPCLLDDLLPPGCVADVVDGCAFASLVAFDFLDTRVLGMRWPGYVNFPEVNLRFYVRDGAALNARRGVSFVREFVPKRWIAGLARGLYNEPYARVPMTSRTDETPDLISVDHSLLIGGVTQRIHVRARKPARVPAEGSIEHFFKEHQWGFGRTRGGRRVTYRVLHDVWAVYEVEHHDVCYDFAAAYGERWGFLNGATPHHVTLAAGGPVRVSPWRGDLPA